MSMLEEIYFNSYKAEQDEYRNQFDELYEKAQDKKYAISYFLSALLIAKSFTLISELDKEIIALWDHCLKMGGGIEDLLKSLPDRVKEYNLRKEYESKFSPKKNKVKLHFKKLFGLIPYGIENIEISGKLDIGSVFQDFISEEEAAKILGQRFAITDLFEEYKLKYVEHGGNLSGTEIDQPITSPETIQQLRKSLSNCDLNLFFKIVQSLFASLSYEMKMREAYFHSNIHLILKFLDFYVESEVSTNIGRIDSIVMTEKYLYIFEFKQDSCEIAIDQIISKKYYQKYLHTDKEIVLVGVSVNDKERNVVDWKSVRMNKQI